MLWLLPLVPLLAGASVYAAGEKRRSRLAAIAVGALAVSLALALLAAWSGWSGSLNWGATLRLTAALTPLSATVAILVPTVAIPILLYAAAHEDELGLGRLVALLLAFVGAMELLVVADDLLTLLIGWELVGACSWALIGHHWRDAANPRGGLYAFVTTRVGDLGLFLAAMAAFAGTGSFAFASLSQLDGLPLQLLVLGILVSAAAKSGQIPFSPWLFRAMAGPTSVSALLHAATMVAAGAYLLTRLQPVLDRVDWFAPAAIGIGLATALGGGLVALLQDHAKKLLAASTSAHFGLMFVAVGAGYPAIAVLHLVAHACFKALLFLSAGIAGQRANSFLLAHTGFGRSLPLIAAFTAVGALALAGVPPLGGAWTKEAVTTAAGHVNALVALATIVAGGLSAAYAARFQLLAFGFGDADETRPAPPQPLETAALATLAGLSLMLAALWIPGVRQSAAPLLGTMLPEPQLWERVGSLVAVAVGLYIGQLLAFRYALLGTEPPSAALADWLGLRVLIDNAVTRPSLALAHTAARLDDSHVDALPRGVATLARGLAAVGGRFGELIADALPEGAARVVGIGGSDTQRLQTGLSHHYYALVAIGAVSLLGILFIWS